MVTIFFRICFLVLTICSINSLSFTQKLGEVKEQPDIINEVLTCELDLLHQDLVVGAALERVKNGEVLIVLLHLGKEETDRNLSVRRLLNIHKYFQQRGRGLSPKQVFIATGSQVEGNGRVEFYLRGLLYQQLLYPKNGFICHSCCGPDPEYYPDRKVSSAKKRGVK